MANYTTAKDILDDVLFRIGENTDGSSDYHAAALRYINRAYQALWMGGSEFNPQFNERWWWLRENANIIVEHSVTGATVSVTKGSASITFSSGPNPTISANVTNWYLKTQDHRDVFRISSHTTSGTSATLDSVWTGDTSTSAQARLFKLEYTLNSGVMVLTEPMTVQEDNLWAGEVRGISVENMNRYFPLHDTQAGIPDRFAAVDEDNVRFNRYPKENDLVRVDYHYLKQPADLAGTSGETTVIPKQYRRILSPMAMFWVAQDKNDNRRNEYAQEGTALLQKMARENMARWASIGEIGHVFPRTRTGTNRLYNRLLRTDSGHILG